MTSFFFFKNVTFRLVHVNRKRVTNFCDDVMNVEHNNLTN